MKELQKQLDMLVHSFAPHIKNPYWQPLEMLASLIEEVGELARELNHRFGQKKKKPNEKTIQLEQELADVVIQATLMANAFEIDLDKALQEKIAVLAERDKDRFIDKR